MSESDESRVPQGAFQLKFSRKVAHLVAKCRLFNECKDISTACRQKGLLFPRYFYGSQPETNRKCLFEVWRRLDFLFDIFNLLRTFRKRMGKQSGARCETHREIKVFPVVPTPEAIPNRTCNRNTPCVPSALSPSSRSPSPARTLPPTTPSPRTVWSRLATPTLVRYVSPRVHHCFVSVASREVTTRARARRAGDRLTSRACACVRARVRDESSAIHALLCARAARPLTFPPRRLSVADRLPLRGQLPRHLLHRFPRQRDGRHQALLHR